MKTLIIAFLLSLTGCGHRFHEDQKVAVKTLNGDPGTVVAYNWENETYLVEYYDAMGYIRLTECHDSDLVAFADDSTAIR